MPELRYCVEPGHTLSGRVRVPGDKSISHRAVMLGALAEGPTRVHGFLEGADCRATAEAFKAMGVRIGSPQCGVVDMEGVGLHGLIRPSAALFLGNAGTAMRLMAGILAGQAFDTVVTGDESLTSRPMQRITAPLGRMGARIETSKRGTAPLQIYGGQELSGIDYAMPVASAQVKSSLLLAGLYAKGKTCISEPAPSRDHTERMLESFGCPVERESGRVCVSGGARLRGCTVNVPADISSAAFFLVGGCIAPGSELILESVGVNPTRTGIIDILRLMGARIEIENPRQAGAEPVADIRVRSSRLHGVIIPQELVPLAIDEFPVLFVAAACADGRTVLTGAEELRVKESDRIQVMAEGLQALGINATPHPDGMTIDGGALMGGEVNSHGDHRVAMAFAMAGLRAQSTIRVQNCANVDTSFPGFAALCGKAGMPIHIT